MSTLPALIVAICAAAIALGAAIIALFALRTARAAHALNERRDREERERREAEQLEQARLVMLVYSHMGAPAVDVENRSAGTITDVEVESIECPGTPGVHAETNRLIIGGNPAAWPSIDAGDKRMHAFVLIDENGERDDLRSMVEWIDWQITAAYTDAQGQRWRRTNSGDPVRIER